MELKKKDIVVIGSERINEEDIEYYDMGVIQKIGEEGVYVKVFNLEGSLSDYDTRYRRGELEKVSEDKALERLKRGLNKKVEETFEELKDKGKI